MDLSLYVGVLKAGLELWSSKEATKYLDRVVKLEKEYNDEMAKHPDDRSDLSIDGILLELRILGQSFSKFPGKKP